MTNSMFKTIFTCQQASPDEETEVLSFDFFNDYSSTDLSTTTFEPDYISDSLDFLNEYCNNFNDNTADYTTNASESGSSESGSLAEDFDSDSWSTTIGDNTTDTSEPCFGGEDFDTSTTRDYPTDSSCSESGEQLESTIGGNLVARTATLLGPGVIDRPIMRESSRGSTRLDVIPTPVYHPLCHVPSVLPMDPPTLNHSASSVSSLRVPSLLREVRTDAGTYGPSPSTMYGAQQPLTYNSPDYHKAAYRKLKTEQWRLKRLNRRFGGLKYPCRRAGALKRKRENGRFAGFDFTKHHCQ